MDRNERVAERVIAYFEECGFTPNNLDEFRNKLIEDVAKVIEGVIGVE